MNFLILKIKHKIETATQSERAAWGLKFVICASLILAGLFLVLLVTYLVLYHSPRF